MHQKRPKNRRPAAGNRQAEPATSTPANIERATAAATDRPHRRTPPGSAERSIYTPTRKLRNQQNGKH